MHLEVHQFVKTCDSCQRNKHLTVKPAGLLQPLQIPDRRWEHVTMDLITHLPKTPRGHDAIMVFVDKLSKYVRFAPTTTDVHSTGAAFLFLDKVVSLFGLPKKLITDRDPRFTGNMFQAFCKMFGIQSALSTAFHPQTDGQTEKYNSVLEDLIRHYISPDQTNWDDLLPAAEFAVNNSKNESTGETPAFLMQGQHPLTPVTIQTDSTVPAARLFASQLQQTIIKVQHNLRKAQERQKAHADQNRTDITGKLSVGDQVLLSTRNLTLQAKGTRKFLPKFIGPFTIKEFIGKVAVRLQLPHNYCIHPVFHVSLIRPYHQSEHTITPPPPLQVDADGIPIYEVEEVLEHRPLKQNRQNTWQFLIKWTGYGHEHNSWEPYSNIANPDITLQPYWDSLGGIPELPKRGRKRKAPQALVRPKAKRKH